MTLEEELALIKTLLAGDASVGGPCVMIGWHDGGFSTVVLGSQNADLVRARVRNVKMAHEELRADGPPMTEHASRFVIVPNVISEEIYARIDAVLAEIPDAAPDRELFYQRLLAFFDEHGYVPEFSLAKGDQP
jgi:hypothetical protein